jgi:hypothetical protein
MASTPAGFTNISTTYQRAYQTYDGNVQVRKIGDRLWEILPRGGASIYEKSRPAALERAFQLAASASARRSSRKGRH